MEYKQEDDMVGEGNSDAITDTGADELITTEEEYLKTSKRQFECPECGKSFTMKKTLNRHMKSLCRLKQEKVKTFSIEDCDTRFYSRVVSENHPFKKHSPMYSCEACQETFSLEEEYKIHSLFHTLNKLPFKCGICDSSFKHCEELVKHLLLHTENVGGKSLQGNQNSCRNINIQNTGTDSASYITCKEEPSTVTTKVKVKQSVHKNTGKRKSKVKSNDSEAAGRSRDSQTRVMPKRKATLIPRFNHTEFISSEVASDNCNNEEFESVFQDENDMSDENDDFVLDVETEKSEDISDCEVTNNSLAVVNDTVTSLVKSLMSSNNRSNQKEDNFICEVCGQTFRSSCYRTHMKTHNITASSVDKGTKTEISVKNKKSNLEKSHECYHCFKRFSSKPSLNMHLKLHTGQKHKCEICGKAYVNRYNLIYHTKLHSGNTKYHCSVCNRPFCSKSQLDYHFTLHTGVKAFTCEICGKDFRLSNMLKTHLKTHSQDKRFMCDICGKKFLFMGGLKKHSFVHSGEKPHVCAQCGKSFSVKMSLVQHMNIHTGEGYSCQQCGRVFAQKANLNRHKRIHTGARPYPCNMCDKTFRTSNDKKRHMRIHTGDKPYKCEKCGKGFSQVGNLKTHLKVHQNEKKAPENFNIVQENVIQGNIVKNTIAVVRGNVILDSSSLASNSVSNDLVPNNVILNSNSLVSNSVSLVS